MINIIKNGLVYLDNSFKKLDIAFQNGKIIEVGIDINIPDAHVVDATDLHIFPGFVDLHAHLRDPGHTNKEDIVSGTRAAAKGGFTTICAMPNTDPVVDNIASVEYIKRKAHDLGSCKVLVIGAVTKKSEGKEIAEIAIMLEGGIVAVSDDGGCVQSAKLMLSCMKYAHNFKLPVIVHAEDYNLAGRGQINAGCVSTRLGLGAIPALAEEIIISRDIMLAEASGCRLHIAHISTAKSIEMVRVAKANGINITCEVTPHHLTLTEDACLDFDTNTKVKPPLRTEADRQACIAGLIDGTIDFIATDHAPHADYEKILDFTEAPYGINGFETAFASLYTHLVQNGLIPLELLIEKLASAPSTFLGLPTGQFVVGHDADICIANLNENIELTADSMLSKSKNTPYFSHQLAGKIIQTFCAGRTTWVSK